MNVDKYICHQSYTQYECYVPCHTVDILICMMMIIVGLCLENITGLLTQMFEVSCT